jgi:methyltransferase (TIGR00027 family)
MAESSVSHVSDTALWVAAYRAIESARPDALFVDRLADRVAGARGRAIVAASPRGLGTGWSLVTRTKLIDDLILASIADGCDRVLNLAAGMDTRPYRLALPAGFTWIEADLPGIVDEKERLLAGETPGCALRRERVDLSDAAARAAFLRDALEGSSRALVLTEGLLGYLDEAVASALGRDLASSPAIRWWLLDLFSQSALEMLRRIKGHPAAPLFKFAPADGVAFIERCGWKARDVQSILRKAIRFRRAPLRFLPLLLFPEVNPRRPGKTPWYAVVRFERA